MGPEGLGGACQALIDNLSVPVVEGDGNALGELRGCDRVVRVGGNGLVGDAGDHLQGRLRHGTGGLEDEGGEICTFLAAEIGILGFLGVHTGVGGTERLAR